MLSVRLFGIVMVAFVAILSLFATNPVFACSCKQPPHPLVALQNSDAVFAGKVIDIKIPDNVMSSADPMSVTFAVNQTWKGHTQKTINVSTEVSSASCGYEFQIGETYLVYANGQDSLHTSLCSRTTTFANSYEDLRSLGDGMIPGDDSQSEFGPDKLSEYFNLMLIILVISVSCITIYAIKKRRQ